MPSTNDQPKTDQATGQAINPPTDQRVSVAEAAVLLGLSENAVRSRLKRGTLRKEKAKDGTVLVVLGAGGSPNQPTNSTARPIDQSPTGQTDKNDLVEALRDQVSFLRRELDEEREANRENRRIIAGLVQRVPELEAAAEPREASVLDSEEAYSTHAAPPDPETPVSSEQRKRSWWREFFGLE